MRVRFLLLPLGVAVLTACHADITERFDLNADGSGTVTLRETMDDQFAQIARSQSADPFGTEAARKSGWSVEQTLDDNGNHIVTMRRSFARGHANDVFHGNGLGQKTELRNVDLEQSGNPFRTTFRLRTTIPRLMPASSSNDPWANAGASMAASLVSIHLVLATPGQIDETNGERASDGSVRWNLSLTEPTTVSMAVTYTNWPLIGAALAAVAVVLAGVLLAVRRSRTARPVFGPVA